MDSGGTPDGTTKTLAVAEVGDILNMLPHRYPFLMIDRVIDIDGDRSGIGIKNVTFNEPHFQGHFPGEPVMPGVLMIEGMAQTAGVLCMYAEGRERPRLVYLMTVDKAKFRKPVRPGDVIEYHMKKERQRGSIWRFHGEAIVGDTLVAEADVSAMIVQE
ncbi:3-hydroxyacyl-[acyl-carrier-protein] dehydratase FabZ [Acuticoccus sediminis]|uniref:3-hydroxyacyl-[acyl-carrier-protein] dehydratase FabZ n=1 Tax=Acuticoccus sediminis TaxID=2184697 RepID=A0A8B2NR56_9HYPH|nr:3-hydroxyacyl-ACP dehydratase FabZ [Acuticoccus sediminis]RAH99812.1 3-hydroxyacyl-[acyl-carrier-protein] dehydratase FabZ [Acuticoccus sediminis]